MDSITDLRDDLFSQTQNILDLILKRAKLVTQIQSLKEVRDIHWCYDQKRELEIFTEQSEVLCQLSDKELLAFSLIIESQASVDTNSYPAWSQRTHLKKASRNILEMVNPNLLFVINISAYNELHLGPGFDTISEI